MGLIYKVYHYTSIESLYGILSSIKNTEVIHEDDVLNWLSMSPKYTLTMHATHLCYMNDMMEGQLVPEALIRCGFSEVEIFASTATLGCHYIISFSTKNDDINMWHRYANNGHGVALGFSIGEEDIIINEKYIKKCEYKTIEEVVSSIKENNIKQPNNEITNLMRFVNDKLCVNKASAFSTENEIRIVVEAPSGEEFYVKNGNFIPYYNVPIKLSALQSIRFGPLVKDCERLKFSVQRFIKSKTGLDFDDTNFEQSRILLAE